MGRHPGFDRKRKTEDRKVNRMGQYPDFKEKQRQRCKECRLVSRVGLKIVKVQCAGGDPSFERNVKSMGRDPGFKKRNVKCVGHHPGLEGKTKERKVNHLGQHLGFGRKTKT